MDRGFDQDCEPDFGHHGVCSRYCRGIDLGGSIVEIAAGTRGFIAAFNIHTPVLSTLQERFGRRKRLRSRLVQARLKAAAPVWRLETDNMAVPDDAGTTRVVCDGRANKRVISKKNGEPWF